MLEGMQNILFMAHIFHVTGGNSQVRLKVLIMTGIPLIKRNFDNHAIKKIIFFKSQLLCQNWLHNILTFGGPPLRGMQPSLVHLPLSYNYM